MLSSSLCTMDLFSGEYSGSVVGLLEHAYCAAHLGKLSSFNKVGVYS